MGKWTRITLYVLCTMLVMPVEAARENEYQQWLQQQQQALQQFKDARDRAFSDYLKRQWKEMRIFSGLKRDASPKPVKIPRATPMASPVPMEKPEPQVTTQRKQPPQPVSIPKQVVPKPDVTAPKPPVMTPTPRVEPAKPPVVAKIPTPQRPIVRPPKRTFQPPVVVSPIPQKGQRYTFNFFQDQVEIYADPRIASASLSRVDKAGISQYWEALSRTDYDAVVRQLNAFKKRFNLNGWLGAQLNFRFAEAIYPGRVKEQRLLTWYLLVKAGYQARIGYGDGDIYLLIPTKQQLFEVPYFTFSKVRYYLASFDGRKQRIRRLFTYDGHYPGASQKVDLRMSVLPNIKSDNRNRTYHFAYKGKQYQVPVRFDVNTIKLLKGYPQTELQIYFDAALNNDSSQTLLDSLRPVVAGRSEEDAVNLLLRFVQTAFEYKTDDGQFGEENYLFPEETLYYPFSDCEDRSFLFAWLVRNLLDLDVVGLTFPGHVATAVSFRGPVKGERFSYRGKTYILADPTYINANVGMLMPSLKGARPQVVPIATLQGKS